MKASRYNKVFRATDGTWLAFNSWSTALAEILPDDLAFVKALLADPDNTPCDTAEKREMREAMLNAHFLVDDAMDEGATLKADLMRDRFGPEQFHLTIAPTLNCNFRCDYCYEEHLKITMSKPVEDALVRWVEKLLPGSKEFQVTWYGGEPLLPQAFPIVERLSAAFQKIAAEKGINYMGHLVTNAYLMTPEKIKRLAELGVARVQVTLDGPPEIHDQRRILAGGKGTFWKIIENLKSCIDLAGFQVRINVDRRNALSTLKVLEILEKEGLRGKLRPYLAQVVVDGAACGNIHEACFSSEEFAATEIEIYQAAFEKGYFPARYPVRLDGAYCMAERVNGYVVAPTGSIFKCWHEVTLAPEKAIGSLLDGQQPFQKFNEDNWLGWDALEKPGCRECEILPMCHGGCPLVAMRHPERDHGACEHFKFHLEPLLTLHYLNQGREAEAQGPHRDMEGEANA
ncbi:MAG: radical SAM protein [Planctomycetota bacterium]